jgi:hypothetical protein
MYKRNAVVKTTSPPGTKSENRVRTTTEFTALNSFYERTDAGCRHLANNITGPEEFGTCGEDCNPHAGEARQ